MPSFNFYATRGRPQNWVSLGNNGSNILSFGNATPTNNFVESTGTGILCTFDFILKSATIQIIQDAENNTALPDSVNVVITLNGNDIDTFTYPANTTRSEYTFPSPLTISSGDILNIRFQYGGVVVDVDSFAVNFQCDTTATAGSSNLLDASAVFAYTVEKFTTSYPMSAGNMKVASGIDGVIPMPRRMRLIGSTLCASDLIGGGSGNAFIDLILIKANSSESRVTIGTFNMSTNSTILTRYNDQMFILEKGDCLFFKISAQSRWSQIVGCLYTIAI
jgi:hypothetical protein